MRTAAAIGLAVAMVLIGLPTTTVQAAEDQVVFEGSGWGHGVGMSQYGAYAMAKTGSTYSQILAHYYQGTSIGTLPADTRLWVGLEAGFSAKTLHVEAVPGVTPTGVEITSNGGEPALPPATVGSTIAIDRVGSTGCSVTVNNPGEEPVVMIDPEVCVVDFSWYPWSTPSTNPGTKVRIAGCTISGVACQYARGQLHLRHGGAGLFLSAEMLMDDYVLGISEMPYSWSLEALKAQAVAARSYAESRRRIRPESSSFYKNCWCHVRDTASDQRYVGWGHPSNGPWVSASDATKGRVVVHETTLVTAYYSSSTGGATEHGNLIGYGGPGLVSVNDSWAVDGTVANPNASWTVTVSPASVANAAGFDSLTSMKVTKRRPGSNSAQELQLVGTVNGGSVTVTKTNQWARDNFPLKSNYFDVNYTAPPGSQVSPDGDEMLFYKTNGSYQYVSLHPNGVLGKALQSGSSYTPGWKSISAVDLDGDDQDEVMFYREDGLYRYYDVRGNGSIGSPLAAGSNYTKGWDSITAIDLDGDGQDEMFFYRRDGLYRYYDIRANGTIGKPIASGGEYTKGWDSISAIDLDGDGQDEMFFYREDGLFRYYDIRPDGRIGTPIVGGANYTTGWDSITAVDLDGDGQDEMFFYRGDGLFRFYDIRSNGALSSPIRSGSDFGTGWSIISSVNSDGQ